MLLIQGTLYFSERETAKIMARRLRARTLNDMFFYVHMKLIFDMIDLRYIIN